MRAAWAAAMILLPPPHAFAATLAITIPGSIDGSSMTREEAASMGGCGGSNRSPPITWQGVPPAARSLALTLFDTDARHGAGFVHWLLYDLPPTLTGLPAGAGVRPPAGSAGGVNSPGTRTYFGACPPIGDPPHHYVFRLYALDLALDALRPGLSLPQLQAVMAGHVLAQARTTLTYQRP